YIPRTVRALSHIPFPYTTLFRSVQEDDVRRGEQGTGHGEPLPLAPGQGCATWPHAGVQAVRERVDQRTEAHPGEHRGQRRIVRGDRKSTRLNSSHVSISYAVFCL